VLVLRALFFSLSITWRYVLVFPVVLIGLGLFGLVAAFIGLGLTYVSPLLGAMVVGAFVMGASVLPVMIGARLGLMAQGVKPRNGYAGLMLPAFAYGLFEGLCVWVMLAFAIVTFVFFTPMTIDGLIGLWRLGTEVAFQALLLVDRTVTLAVGIGAAGLIVSLRAALLVPFAGASVGLDPDDRPHSPFYRMGSGFVSLFLLVVLSFAASTYVPVAAIEILNYFGWRESVIATASDLAGGSWDWEDLQDFGWEGVGFLGVYLVLALWTISIQSAGAVLVFMRYKTRVDDIKSQEYALMNSTYRAPKADRNMMSLIRSRMPNRKGK